MLQHDFVAFAIGALYRLSRKEYETLTTFSAVI